MCVDKRRIYLHYHTMIEIIELSEKWVDAVIETDRAVGERYFNRLYSNFF